MDPGERAERSADAPAIGLNGELLGGEHGHLEDAPSPKKLAIFCDGTWNDLRMPHRTNVARLAKCVLPTGLMDLGQTRPVLTPQVVYYDEGVGVGEGVSFVADRAVRYFGGALGRGLDAKIERAYRFIVLNYNPGDEIYLFGFSRGAYTARSFRGLIRKCGVLRRTSFDPGGARPVSRPGPAPGPVPGPAVPSQLRTSDGRRAGGLQRRRPSVGRGLPPAACTRGGRRPEAGGAGGA